MIRALASGLFALVWASAALAHPIMTGSSPVRSSTVSKSPKEIRVAFAEAVNAKESSFTLTGADEKTFKLGPARSDPANPKAIIVPVLETLPSGAYAVRWIVASAGHAKVPGLMRFKVGS